MSRKSRKTLYKVQMIVIHISIFSLVIGCAIFSEISFILWSSGNLIWYLVHLTFAFSVAKVRLKNVCLQENLELETMIWNHGTLGGQKQYYRCHARKGIVRKKETGKEFQLRKSLCNEIRTFNAFDEVCWGV